MIVVMSRIRVKNGNAEGLADQYRNRLHRVESVPGCLGVEILRSLERPDEFLVYTRWKDREAYEGYRRDPAFREAHARIASIPGGIKIDAESRAVEWYEVLS